MNRAERQWLVLLVLAGYVAAAIVAASTMRPLGEVARALAFPGVVYLEAVGALVRFAEIAAVAAAAMNALYAVAGYALWWVGGYLLGIRVLDSSRGELKAIALAFPGVLGVATSAALLVGGVAGAAGLLGEGLSTPAFLGLAVLGAGLWVPALIWLSRMRSARFGWQSRALEHYDTAVEISGYALVLTGLALAVAATVLDVGAQFLVVSVTGALLVAVTVLVPTGGAREPGTGF